LSSQPCSSNSADRSANVCSILPVKDLIGHREVNATLMMTYCLYCKRDSMSEPFGLYSRNFRFT
jgi:hypothetical protein